ncbi:hypothetical protein [Desulfopila aestuarii]|uniref:Holin of 3TMs, for gene-transfer release n=1 Tax=Desulfopila aestuarii DSM 18488 TaxID=1121416 RepID=A0A1M7YJM7_9BACT|nr:hypothetical protein [Desulfopila aestuarii]SHO52824.1 hypothetical protein SAMN02745220_04785 [Desulfopila aestuarii DSM 18488]
MFLETTLIGSALGGLFRLAPEVIRLFDKRNERAHELAMMDKNLEYDAARHKWQLQAVETQGQMVLDAAGMEALVESIRAQGRPTGFVWVDAMSAAVRPLLTFWWVIVLYSLVLGARFYLMTKSGLGSAETITLLWGSPEQGIVSSIFTFWFLDRVIKKRPIS